MPIYPIKNEKGKVTGYIVKINYTDNKGEYQQPTRSARTREEARDIENELYYKFKTKKESADITFVELYRKYMESCRYELRETTIEKKERIFKEYVLPCFSKQKINKITPTHVEEWKVELNRTISERTGNHLSLKTKRNIYSELKSILSYASKFYGLKNNPTAIAGQIKDSNITKSKMDFYTYKEFEQFITVALKHALDEEENKGTIQGWHYYIYFNIAFYMGFRKGEIHALNWKDYKDNKLSINKSLTQKLKGRSNVITPPKTHSSYRDVLIPKALLSILKEHYDRCAKIGEFNKSSFICGIDVPLRDTTIDKRKKNYAEEAGIKNIRMHDFRHSHASVLINAGVNIIEIARRLGHSNIKETLDTYGHLYPEQEDFAVVALDKLTVKSSKFV